MTFTERAAERGYRIVDQDGRRNVTRLRGGITILQILSTVDPDEDMWDTILDHWDHLFRGKQ